MGNSKTVKLHKYRVLDLECPCHVYNTCLDVMTCCVVSLYLTKKLRFCVCLIKRDTSVARTLSLLQYCNIAIVCVFNNLCECLVSVCLDG